MAEFWIEPLETEPGDGPSARLRLGVTSDFLESLAPEGIPPRVVELELAPVRTRLAVGDAIGRLSTAAKTADLRAPFALEVIARNEVALADPRLVVDSPRRRGWLLEARRLDSL